MFSLLLKDLISDFYVTNIIGWPKQISDPIIDIASCNLVSMIKTHSSMSGIDYETQFVIRPAWFA